ncbi:MAG: class 1 isoprenoid biosynthesis enzyme [Ferruginibacter sp.]|nr:class 1 isoprenoid biosynthesis enzyme [Ferruginibacter sp.]
MNKSPLVTLFRGASLVYKIVSNLEQQKKFIRDNIVPELNTAKSTNDGSLDESDIKKITGYYGLAVPAVLGEAFCLLRGVKMTVKERMASTCQGAMTGLFDDFFDKQLLSDEALKTFIEKPQHQSGNNSNEKLFTYFYGTALENTAKPKLVLEHLNCVYRAQVDSKLQAGPGLSIDEIKEITLRKGGASLLFYRTVFTNPMDKAEEDMLYHSGGLMQLSNDIFDVYKDQQHGIQTLVTTTKDIAEIRKLFIELLKDGYTAAYKTHYNTRNIKNFLDIISLGIFSRCFVCLDQLQQAQRLSDNIFSPEKYSRKDMICDMDTALNKWKSLKYYVQYAG